MFSQNMIEKAVRLILNNFVYKFAVTAAQAVAASATGVHAAITDTGVAQTITASITDPAVPRNITATTTGTNTDVKAISPIITGTNFFDQVITETLGPFTVNTNETISGSTAFKTVTSIALPAHDGTGCATSFGWGDILGLHQKRETQVVIDAFLNKTLESTDATVVGDVDEIEKNTIDLNSSLNGTQVDAYLLGGAAS